MTLKTEADAIAGIIDRTLANLAASIGAKTDAAAALRWQISKLRVDGVRAVDDGDYIPRLSDCFNAAFALPVSFAGLTLLHNTLLGETIVGEVSDDVVNRSLLLCIAVEAKLITGFTFTSSDDAQSMMKGMASVFEAIGEKVVEMDDPSIYQALISLSASLTNHLASTARPLPRIITFDLQSSLPALALSERIYYDPSRWEEIVDENKIVHPAFSPRTIRGLAR